MAELKIAVGLDGSGWHERFLEALRTRIDAGADIETATVNLDASDWIARLSGASAVVWKPQHMGQVLASHVKEKIYLMERHMGLTVVPGFETVWTFESKIAQAFLLDLCGLPIPRTLVSFDPDDAAEMLAGWDGPAVLKSSPGAGSTGVRLVEGRPGITARVMEGFGNQLWERAGKHVRNRLVRAVSCSGRRWFWSMARSRLCRSGEAVEPLLVQEFVPGNERDLRITTYGGRCAAGFWRNNRPGDFRASGSGSIDYVTPLPEDAVRLCLEASGRLGFDTMAYDLVFRDGDPLVTEISFGYLDSALHDAPGFFVADDSGALEYREGHVWPQEFWIDRLLEKAGAIPGSARAVTRSGG